MVAIILQKINNQPHSDVRKTKYDKHWLWYKKGSTFSSFWLNFSFFIVSKSFESCGNVNPNWGPQRPLKVGEKCQKQPKSNYQRRRESCGTFFQVMGVIQSVLESQGVRVPNGTNWSLRWPQKRRQECPKLPKGDSQRRRESWSSFFKVMWEI